jgi:hypothetical protein
MKGAVDFPAGRRHVRIRVSVGLFRVFGQVSTVPARRAANAPSFIGETLVGARLEIPETVREPGMHRRAPASRLLGQRMK